jgi:hypothetical protein
VNETEHLAEFSSVFRVVSPVSIQVLLIMIEFGSPLRNIKMSPKAVPAPSYQVIVHDSSINAEMTFLC